MNDLAGRQRAKGLTHLNSVRWLVGYTLRLSPTPITKTWEST